MKTKGHRGTGATMRKTRLVGPSTIVTHDRAGEIHTVSLGDLRVMLVNEDGSWFAQALEIDYASQGATMKEAQDSFARGLLLTIREHLRSYGSIDRLLKPAPVDVWREFVVSAAVQRMTFRQVSVHDLSEVRTELAKTKQLIFPYEQIRYLQQAQA